jgi:hypothetical protein
VPQVPLFLHPFGAPPSEVEQLVHAINLYIDLPIYRNTFQMLYFNSQQINFTAISKFLLSVKIAFFTLIYNFAF